MKMSKSYKGSIQIKYTEVKEPKTVQIRSSRDCYNELRKFYGADIHHKEAFVVTYLNQANHIICIDTDTIGSINQTTVDIKSIIRKALNIGCQAIIIAHNHPSGNKTPSEADRRMTKKLKQACDLLDISLLDHVICTDSEYYSFADNGERSLS
jgi:DNA repair protein RadC